MENKDLMMELMQRQEPLCDELLAYYSSDGNFPKVCHPLLYSVPHSNAMNAFNNYRIKMLLEEKAKLLKEKDWEGYIFIHEKPWRLDAFLSVSHFIESDSEYWRMLGEVWVNSENIWQNIVKWKTALKSQRFNKEAFMSNEDFLFLQSLPETIIVYRGYTPNKNKNGMSFTLNKEKAEWFAKRYRAQGMVLKAKINKKDIFAYMSSRNEDEIILLELNNLL